MSFDHSPIAPLAAIAPILNDDPRPSITAAAHRLLGDRLRTFKNVLSQAHSDALMTMLRGFTRLAFGGRGRIAFPLPTGMGKTQAIVAWCAAAHQAGELCDGGISVAAVTSHIEALCRLKRDLVSAGVPASYIGLLHSYKHDASATNKPRDGYASEPADPDAVSRPILLATHQRVRGGRVDVFNDYQGQRRSLLIWDESLIASCASALSWRDFVTNLAAIKVNLSESGPAYAFLSAAEQTLRKELAAQVAGEPAQSVQLAIGAEELEGVRAELRALGQAHCPAILRPALNTMTEFLNMAAMPLAVVCTDEAEGVITYKVDVPPELEAVAVLDASYPIRELCRMDTGMHQGLEISPNLKRYDQVRVKFADKGAGYETVSRDIKSRTSFYAAMVVQAVQAAGPHASVLVFTFKQRRRSDPDIVAMLRDALSRAGINPDAVVIDPDPKAEPRPRVSFLTWGNEHSLSAYSHCTHVVFAGVLHRSQIDLAASMAGQADDLTLSPGRERIREVLTSELAHYLYQAMSRGSCREVDNGQAKPMTIWLSMQDQAVRPWLDQVAPGMRWESWWPDGIDGSTSTFKVVQRLKAYFSSLPPTTHKVSSAAVKRALGETISKQVWELAIASFEPQSPDWKRQARSWIRLTPS